MDRSARVILLLLVIALTIWRLVRYLQAGLARRPQTGVPSVGGTVVGVPSVSASPVGEPLKGSALSRMIAKTTTVLVFIAGNILVWTCLFGLDVLDQIPTIWRLIFGVLANFPLIRLSHAAGRSIGKRMSPASRVEGSNPFL
ncbi:MAG: hypothetical protein JO184_12625 [Gammaproteobacteria bacterium]|nr:hypothetical protein [Gammaproteobacteria bacterium]